MNEHQRYVLTFGPKDHRRCKIVDRYRGVWTGEKFSRDERDGLVYHDFQTAARDLRLIELWKRSEEPSTTYRGTVNVTVIGESQMDLAELQDYLASKTKLTLNGPAATGQVVLVDIDWGELAQADP